jgi:hypothetical protein
LLSAQKRQSGTLRLLLLADAALFGGDSVPDGHAEVVPRNCSGCTAKSDFRWFMVRFAARLSGVHRYQGHCESGQRAAGGARNAVFVFLCTFGAFCARGDDLTTTAGKTFHDIQVLSRNSSSLLIQSREGEFQFSLSELKPADREKFSPDLTKAIELPALTVIGEQKLDLTTTPERSRAETLAEKEMQRQEEQKQEAHKKKIESYQPLQIIRGVTFSLGVTDPKNDTAILPDYLNADYGRESPDIVEKDIKIFRTSLNNSTP